MRTRTLPKQSTAVPTTQRALVAETETRGTPLVLRAGAGLTLSADGDAVTVASNGGAGSGNVSGPASAVVGHLATYGNTAGTAIADQGAAASIGQSLQIAQRLTIDAAQNPAVDFNGTGNLAGARRARIVMDLEGGIDIQTQNDAGTSPLFNMLTLSRAGVLEAGGAMTAAGKPVLAVTGGFPGGTTTFLRGDGTFAAPAVAAAATIDALSARIDALEARLAVLEAR